MTLPLQIENLSFFFLEKDEAYFICKATTTNPPFSHVRLESTSTEGLSSYRGSTRIKNPLLGRTEEEEKTSSSKDMPTPLHTVLARHCTERETGPKLKPGLKYCLKQICNFREKKNPALGLLPFSRQAYRIKFGHIWASTSLKRKSSHNSGRNRDVGGKPVL